MTSKLLLPLLFLFVGIQFSLAQHIDIDKKALSFISSQEKMNVVFTFDELMVDDLSESDFIKKMGGKITNQANTEEANRWSLEYNNFKYQDWPQTFIAVLNGKIDKEDNPDFFVKDSMDLKYTMKVNTVWMYFGYDAGIIDRPAKVTLQISFYETSMPEKICFATEISRAMGTYNKTDGDGEGVGPSLNRMRKAYYTAGYKFGKALNRVLD